jgi:hypothetical protein
MKAIEIVRQIREAHYEQLKDKTPQERLAFYREKAQVMNKRVKTILDARQTLKPQEKVLVGQKSER